MAVEDTEPSENSGLDKMITDLGIGQPGEVDYDNHPDYNMELVEDDGYPSKVCLTNHVNTYSMQIDVLVEACRRYRLVMFLLGGMATIFFVTLVVFLFQTNPYGWF